MCVYARSGEGSFVLAVPLPLLLYHTNLCICWTNTYLCRSFFFGYPTNCLACVSADDDNRKHKIPNHYKPHQTRCSYRPFSNFIPISFTLWLSFFSSSKLSHTIFIVCYVCMPVPRQLLFFRHHFQPDISLIEFSHPFRTDKLLQRKTMHDDDVNNDDDYEWR